MRALLPLVLAACFTPRTPAQKPRALVYNALVVAAGLASVAVGYEVAKRAPDGGTEEDGDGLGPFFVGLVGGGGMVGGTFLVIGGLSGMAFTAFDYAPTH
jgi:hypothetical protein